MLTASSTVDSTHTLIPHLRGFVLKLLLKVANLCMAMMMHKALEVTVYQNDKTSSALVKSVMIAQLQSELEHFDSKCEQTIGECET